MDAALALIKHQIMLAGLAADVVIASDNVIRIDDFKLKFPKEHEFFQGPPVNSDKRKGKGRNKGARKRW